MTDGGITVSDYTSDYSDIKIEVKEEDPTDSLENINRPAGNKSQLNESATDDVLINSLPVDIKVETIEGDNTLINALQLENNVVELKEERDEDQQINYYCYSKRQPIPKKMFEITHQSRKVQRSKEMERPAGKRKIPSDIEPGNSSPYRCGKLAKKMSSRFKKVVQVPREKRAILIYDSFGRKKIIIPPKTGKMAIVAYKQRAEQLKQQRKKRRERRKQILTEITENQTNVPSLKSTVNSLKPDDYYRVKFKTGPCFVVLHDILEYSSITKLNALETKMKSCEKCKRGVVKKKKVDAQTSTGDIQFVEEHMSLINAPVSSTVPNKLLAINGTGEASKKNIISNPYSRKYNILQKTPRKALLRSTQDKNLILNAEVFRLEEVPQIQFPAMKATAIQKTNVATHVIHPVLAKDGSPVKPTNQPDSTGLPDENVLTLFSDDTRSRPSWKKKIGQLRKRSVTYMPADSFSAQVMRENHCVLCSRPYVDGIIHICKTKPEPKNAINPTESAATNQPIVKEPKRNRTIGLALKSETKLAHLEEITLTDDFKEFIRKSPEHRAIPELKPTINPRESKTINQRIFAKSKKFLVTSCTSARVNKLAVEKGEMSADEVMAKEIKQLPEVSSLKDTAINKLAVKKNKKTADEVIAKEIKRLPEDLILKDTAINKLVVKKKKKSADEVMAKEIKQLPEVSILKDTAINKLAVKKNNKSAHEVMAKVIKELPEDSILEEDTAINDELEKPDMDAGFLVCQKCQRPFKENEIHVCLVNSKLPEFVCCLKCKMHFKRGILHKCLAVNGTLSTRKSVRNLEALPKMIPQKPLANNLKSGGVVKKEEKHKFTMELNTTVISQKKLSKGSNGIIKESISSNIHLEGNKVTLEQQKKTSATSSSVDVKTEPDECESKVELKTTDISDENKQGNGSNGIIEESVSSMIHREGSKVKSVQQEKASATSSSVDVQTEPDEFDSKVELKTADISDKNKQGNGSNGMIKESISSINHREGNVKLEGNKVTSEQQKKGSATSSSVDVKTKAVQESPKNTEEQNKEVEVIFKSTNLSSSMLSLNSNTSGQNGCSRASSAEGNLKSKLRYFKCSKCPKIFKKQLYLDLHQLKMCPGVKITCTDCLTVMSANQCKSHSCVQSPLQNKNVEVLLLQKS